MPESLIAFLDSHDIESAIRLAVSLGGDTDTMACIAGAVAEAFYGSVPDFMVDEIHRRVPGKLWSVVEEFRSTFCVDR